MENRFEDAAKAEEGHDSDFNANLRPFLSRFVRHKGTAAAQELSKVCSKRVGEVTGVKGRQVRPEFAYYFYVATKG